MFTGSHPLKISWIKNGKVVNEESVLTSNVSNLIFENLTLADAGKYTCMVKNKAGVEEMDVLLDVLCECEYNNNFIYLFIQIMQIF